jgi:pimeloyl-ACP methyl ester carboxylesterase
MPTLGRLRYLEALPPASSPRQPAARGGPRTLVLLHAFPLNAHMWEPQLELAELGWRVIAPHLRGMGGGEQDPPASSMQDYVGDLVDLLDGLHIHNAVIAGLSLGGYVALSFFRAAPNYFAGIILADTRAEADTAEGIEARQRMQGVLANEGIGGVVDQMLPRLVADITRQSQPEIDERIRRMAALNSAAGVNGAIAAMMTRPDSTALLGSIQCPALIIVGQEDVLTPQAHSQKMNAAIRGSELVVLPEAGHLSNLEQPKTFNSTIGRFLEHRV